MIVVLVGVGQRKGADLLGAVGQAHPVDEPAVGDGELHDSGNRLLEDRRERRAVGHRDRVAGAPGDLRAAERGVGSGKLHLLAVAEQEAAETGLLPDEVVARCARVAAWGRDRRGRARVSRDERERQRRGREHAQRALALRPLGEGALVTAARDEHEHRNRPARREAQADHNCARNAREPDAERQQRPARCGGDEGRDACSEQDAVEEQRPWERHRPAPGLRNLEADLRPDAEPGEVRDHGRGGERGRGDHEGPPRLDRRAERSEGAEDQRGAQAEPGREGGARGDQRSASSESPRGTHGADHGEASGRPGTGEPDEQPGQRERGRQHLIFVSKYMTQNTCLPW